MPYRPGFTKHIHTNYIPDVRDGQVRGFYTLVTDVTEQVEARAQVLRLNAELKDINAELNASNTQLTHTNIDLDNFIYTASHDLRAPITNIEGLLQTLQAEIAPQPPPSEVPYILELMHDSVERFTNDARPPHRRVEAAKGARAASRARGPAAPHRGPCASTWPRCYGPPTPRLTVDVRAVPTVRFPAKNLRSVIYNLLSNAVKYRQPSQPPAISVRARREADWVVLAVQDNGPGHRPEPRAELIHYVSAPTHARRGVWRGPVHGEAHGGKRGRPNQPSRVKSAKAPLFPSFSPAEPGAAGEPPGFPRVVTFWPHRAAVRLTP